MATLNAILGSLEPNPQKLKIVSNSHRDTLILVPETLKLPQDFAQMKAEANALKAGAKAIYPNLDNTKSLEQLSNLFAKVLALANSEVPANKVAMVAGEAFRLQLTGSFDPHYGFMPVDLSVPKALKFSGLGMEISKLNWSNEMAAKLDPENIGLQGAIAMKPFPGSSSEAAGIQKGDLLLAVNGVSMKDKSVDDAKNLIRGPEGTTVKLTIQGICDGKVKDIEATRAAFSYQADWLKDTRFVSLEDNVESRLDEQCGRAVAKPKPDPTQPPVEMHEAMLVKLTQFMLPPNPDGSQRSLWQEFVDFQRGDISNPMSMGMIIDLRNNRGGYLRDTEVMLDSMIGAKGVMVSEKPVENGKLIEGAASEDNYEFETLKLTGQSGKSYHYHKPCVVLINKDSASASEVFAGTVQDMQRCWVVGDRSFGKGSVQTGNPEYNPPLAGWEGIKGTPLERRDTTAIYILPSGRSPQNYGIIPDFRFDEYGKPIVDDENYLNTEKSFDGAIGYNADYQWEQTRQDEVDKMAECLFNNKIAPLQGDVLKAKMESDGRFNRPFITDYQLELAQDILHCSERVVQLL